MIFTILGCGTSTGVPLISCSCPVCQSDHPKNRRLRCSAWVQVHGKSFLIDTSTDLREQALRARISRVDAVLYTHPHADHIHGIDELRSFNYVQRAQIPIYCNGWSAQDVRERFPYIFTPSGSSAEGGGIPMLQLKEFNAAEPSISVEGVPVTPIRLEHGAKESVGYRIDSVAYVTDCSYIPSESLDRLKGLSVLFLDCVRLEPHKTHFNLDQALEVVSKVQPKQTYLTHLGHDFDYEDWAKKLPPGVALAYDGLIIKDNREVSS